MEHFNKFTLLKETGSVTSYNTTMTAQELRIGNLVMYGNDIIKIGASDFAVLKMYESKGQESSYKPIPLTKVRLLEFDWFSIDDDRYTFRDIEYYTISNEGSLYFSGDYTCTDIKYVHQLQNLYFALTGNELTVK